MLLIPAAAPAGGPQAWPDSPAIATFQRAADDYAFAHRRIERRMPPLEVTADAATLRRAIDAMAVEIRAARDHAREGDLFTPALQPILRARIARAMRANDLTALDFDPEDVGVGAARLTINGDMPWRLTVGTPPCILAVLPHLPPELEYRIVGVDLVLVDVHASLIVDILRDATLPLDTIR